MRLLVTGGAGFIGGHFIRHMQKTRPDAEIFCLDALTYATEGAEPPENRPGLCFIKGDIADGDLVGRMFRRNRFTHVVNFATETHVDRSISDPGIFVRSNVEGTRVLLDACVRQGVTRFHQVSTDEVYGDLPLGRPDLLFDEGSPPVPSSPYAASKAAADLLALAYRRTYGLPVTISRSSNNYGPRQHPEKLIPRMVTLAADNRPLPLYGDGLNVRDWLYVGDHCAAVAAILAGGTDGEVYNIGGGNERSNLQIVRAILERLGKPDSLICFTDDRAGHDRRYALDCSKIKKELGWVPQKPFEEGLNGTIDWYAGRAGHVF